MGFTKSEANPNLYFIFVDADLLIFVLYVDDPFLTGLENLIAGFKADMATEFEMEDISMMRYLLALGVVQRPGEIFLGQGKYVVEILNGRLYTYDHAYDH